MPNNNNNTAAEPPGEGGNSGGDIEQGRSSPPPSWVAAVISDSDHTPTPTTISSMTTRPGSRRLEHVDVDEAAPVPLLQQIADMEIEKYYKSRNIINSNNVPTTPQQGAMEQIEERNDAAPRPFNSAEFEDHDLMIQN